MSDGIGLVQIVQALSVTYRDEGVAIWLDSEHKSGHLEGQRPITLCRTADGLMRVAEAVHRLDGVDPAEFVPVAVDPTTEDAANPEGKQQP